MLVSCRDVSPPKSNRAFAAAADLGHGTTAGAGAYWFVHELPGGGAISHLALCAGLCTVATVVVAAVDPSAREAANHLGDHLVGAMGGQTSASPEATRDDRAFLPNRPSADDVIHAQADPSDFTGDFGQFLADQARDDRLGQDSFKSADGTVPKQVQVAGWPLIPLLAGGGGATAGGAAAGGGSAAAGATVGLAGTFLAWLGIRNAPPELDLVARALNPLEIIGAALGLTDASPEMELVSRVLLNPGGLLGAASGSAFMDLEEARPTSNATPRPPPLNDTLVTKPTDYRPGAEGYRGEDGESVRQDPGFAPVVVDTSVLTNKVWDPVDLIDQVPDDKSQLFRWRVGQEGKIRTWELVEKGSTEDYGARRIAEETATRDRRHARTEAKEDWGRSDKLQQQWDIDEQEYLDSLREIERFVSDEAARVMRLADAAFERVERLYEEHRPQPHRGYRAGGGQRTEPSTAAPTRQPKPDERSSLEAELNEMESRSTHLRRLIERQPTAPEEVMSDRRGWLHDAETRAADLRRLLGL